MRRMKREGVEGAVALKKTPCPWYICCNNERLIRNAIMKRTIFLVLFFTTVVCHAQTKVIAHKSHGGSSGSFAKAYRENSVDIKEANFGLPGKVNIVVLDTVIAVNDSVTILKMRESAVCYPYGTNYKDLKETDYDFRSDTLVNDAVFTRRNSVVFIKKSRGNYPVWFQNPVEQVVIIGFKEE
jgi:hypothetical protein